MSGVIHVPLAHLLIAFTIEFDNEFEHRMPHRTARGPAAHSGRGPWLISQPFWANFLRYVDGPTPLTALPAELVNVPGLVRWGYLRVEDGTVVPTPAGTRARTLFAPLAAEIEERWVSRYGDRVADLRRELAARLVARLSARPMSLPAHLPMTAPSRPDRTDWPVAPADPADRADRPAGGDPARVTARADRAAGDAGRPASAGDADDLSVLLARTLLLVTADVAADAGVPMGLGANTLRALTADGVRTRDLPRLTGTAREAVSVSLSALQRAGAAEVASGVARLTPRGVRERERFTLVTGAVSTAWRADDLAAAAGAVLADTGGLVAGLTPPPDGWRAHPPYVSLTRTLLKDPANGLARYPMVSHRGGYPDGS